MSFHFATLAAVFYREEGAMASRGGIRWRSTLLFHESVAGLACKETIGDHHTHQVCDTPLDLYIAIKFFKNYFFQKMIAIASCSFKNQTDI